MTAAELLDALDREATGRELLEQVQELYPICRSITGDGVRQTLAIVARDVALDVHEVPTGTEVLDWTIPREWNIREAWIESSAGERVVDLRDSNLHVVGYSIPVRARMSLEALRPHLHSIPEHPSWVPYRTSYYRETWGFCLTHERLESLEDGEYDVCIDSSLENGSLTYGEIVLPGRSEHEVLVSAHVCHPSLANDNLSGVVVAAALAKLLAQIDLRYTYRFVFAPGTIGAITWLARNRERVDLIRAGLVLAGVGDSGAFTFKRSRRGDTEIDRAVGLVLRDADGAATRMFSPDGYDERQYCSPGFDLPVGCLMRTPHGEYPEYHTSADNLSFLDARALAGSLAALPAVVDALESNRRLVNTAPYGEPQLGRRGLYRPTGGRVLGRSDEQALLWVLSLADGDHDLMAIAERSGLGFADVRRAAARLLEHDLVRTQSADDS